MCDIEPLEWHGLYGNDQKFKKYLSPETIVHPAKMSMRLADKIITHLEQLDLLHKGDRVIDFMAGTARTGVVAELHGYAFTGIELEDHFIRMIEKNNNTLKGKILREPKWEIIQGDARHLSELLNGGVAITSPPYGDTSLHGGDVEQRRKRLIEAGYDPKTILGGNARSGEWKGYSAIVSPPYSNRLADNDTREFMDAEHKHKRPNTSYSAIVSPPYGEMIGQNGGPIDPNYKVGVSTLTARKYSDTSTNIGNLKDVGIVSPPYGLGEGLGHSDTPGKIIDEKSLHRRYGNSNGQIGNLKDVGIVSPPYESADNMFHDPDWMNTVRPRPSNPVSKERLTPTESNIANKRSETYLSAMQQVYSESYKAGISPLVTVTKNPTKNHKLRRLDLDTAMLLEKVGYKIVDYHQAVLFKTKTQQTLFGEEKTEIKGQVSFFKRLSMQKGNVAADHEDIIFAVI
jgi:hypothetical protein